MFDEGYFINFNNEENGTGKLHYEVLQKYGMVVWGQWRTGKSLLSPNTQKNMNKKPFYLYALDKKAALLKMHVIHVFTREEIIINNLTTLIPSYYNLDTPCSAYYLIDNISILPVEYAKQIIVVNSKQTIINAKQVNSARPWKVIETIPSFQNLQNIEYQNNLDQQRNCVLDITNHNNIYFVYRYHSITSDKNYIGLTNDIVRRRKEHENPKNWEGSKKFLYVFMSIMGLGDFEFEILHSGLSKTDAQYWEAKEIERFNAYYPNGFNERNESANLERNKPIYV